MIVVLSPKGGAGKTTVSVNLAVGLARRDPGGVVLVDLDVAFGDVASTLLLDPRTTFTDVLTGTPVAEALLSHPSGLRVLLAPEDDIPDPAWVGPQVRSVLDDLVARFPTVVVDTGAGIDAVTRAAVARATDLVLVGAMDVATLLDLRKVLRMLEGDLSGSVRRHLVVNRTGADLSLEIEDAAAATGLQVDVVIPHDLAVARASNEGVPLAGREAEGPGPFDALVRRFA